MLTLLVFGASHILFDNCSAELLNSSCSDFLGEAVVLFSHKWLTPSPELSLVVYHPFVLTLLVLWTIVVGGQKGNSLGGAGPSHLLFSRHSVNEHLIQFAKPVGPERVLGHNFFTNRSSAYLQGPLGLRATLFTELKTLFGKWRERDSKPGSQFRKRALYQHTKVTRFKIHTFLFT